MAVFLGFFCNYFFWTKKTAKKVFSVLEGVIPDTLVPFLRIVYLCQFFVDFSGAVDKTDNVNWEKFLRNPLF